ncbi:hypothetical protein DSCW_11560 [Desulfosarcina widdelii]|uniref:PRC-barrel domain-containing protein n=1 Tax=Desulfosarcina widdelii TaxID=947919 RepID=A0A5K7Z0H1_9BACT|nr:hypothetical protein DSCW_11560 [Desulfosarcina widdelii]
MTIPLINHVMAIGMDKQQRSPDGKDILAVSDNALRIGIVSQIDLQPAAGKQRLKIRVFKGKFQQSRKWFDDNDARPIRIHPDGIERGTSKPDSNEKDDVVGFG